MKTAEQFIEDYCTIEYDQSGSESHRVETAMSNVEDAMKAYALQEVRIALEKAAERCNYPYKDFYGCVCDVPSIILATEINLT